MKAPSLILQQGGPPLFVLNAGSLTIQDEDSDALYMEVKYSGSYK